MASRCIPMESSGRHGILTCFSGDEFNMSNKWNHKKPPHQAVFDSSFFNSETTCLPFFKKVL